MELVGTPPGAAGRKRLPNRERPAAAAAEDDALKQVARQAEARLAAKRAARAEAREIRMKELERQQKEIYQVQKKYCGLDAKFGDIEQWMEDTERYNRKPRRYTSVSDEDERMSVGSRGSLKPSEYSYYLGSGSRTSSRASSARASPVVEERPDKDFERGVRTVSSLSAATLASLGGTSSRRGSGDTSMSVDTEASIREIKDSLAEVEEKYKKAMVSNAQLDNEKTNFMYQVDALKDALLELEEQLAESRRQYEEKNKDFEREKHAHNILQFQFMEVKEVLKQREELLAEIQQLQQKQEGYIREMSDLQETIEWKEKKIGALERQKEFFDSIRSERDDLREEVNMLKEQLKKHGIIPSTEVAANGETCDRLSGSSTIVPVTSHAVKVAEGGALGRAIEMEMKNESVTNVRKREILQSTENEEHTEENEEMEIVQECLDTKTLHTDGNVEAQKITGGQVVSALSLNSGLEEPAKNHSVHVPKIVCYFKNSDVAELRDEWGLLGNITEVKETNTENIKDGNVVNKIENDIADPCIKANLETNIMSEILSEEQNKENQKYILGDEAGTSDNEVFEGTLDSVTGNPTATSSQLEPLKSAEDALTGAARIESNECPREARKTRENKVVGSDLESQVAEGERGFEITDSAEWSKKGADKTKERNKTENALLQQETKVVPSAVERRETLCACESAPAEFIEEEKQLEMQEPQSVSVQQDLLVEEEQKEQETRESENNTGKSHTEKTEQREALLGTMDADSEKNNEQRVMKEILSGKTVVDSASPSECQIHEERILEDDSRKYKEIKPEFIPDGKTLAHISAANKEFAEGHEEDNPTQVKYESTGEQSTEEQVEIVQEPAVITITEDTAKAAEGGKGDENPRKAEERHDIVPDIQESQKADFSIQEEKPESEDEEAGEEYHEAIDFGEFPSGELNISERNVNQGNGEEKNKQKEEEGEATEGAMQNVLKEDGDNECKDEEQVAEDSKKKQTDQSSENKEIKERILTDGDENIQDEKQKESEKAEYLQTDSSVSVSAKAPGEVLCNTNGKLLDENNTKETAECTSEQLEEPGRVVGESQEEMQGSKKGKGKSREDCVVA